MELVGVSDTSKDVPMNFQEAWHHEDLSERKLWREAIIKEFHDMIRLEYGGTRKNITYQKIDV